MLYAETDFVDKSRDDQCIMLLEVRTRLRNGLWHYRLIHDSFVKNLGCPKPVWEVTIHAAIQ
jgi:hypothetical protein